MVIVWSPVSQDIDWGGGVTIGILWLKRLLGRKNPVSATWQARPLAVPFLWQDTDIQWPIRLIIGHSSRGSEQLHGAPSQGKQQRHKRYLRVHTSSPTFRGCCFRTVTVACLPALWELLCKLFQARFLVMTPQRPLAGRVWQGIFPRRKHVVRVFNTAFRRVHCGRTSPCDHTSTFLIRKGNHQTVTGILASHQPGKTQIFVSLIHQQKGKQTSLYLYWTKKEHNRREGKRHTVTH